jgi:cysteine desulfurase/selenocysteine lyase
MLAPVGIGGLFVKKDVLETLRPFHYGGDMIAEGKVTDEKVEYDELPWRFTAGTPNIVGTILAGEVTELIVELVLGEKFDGDLRRESTKRAMNAIREYEKVLVQYLIDELESIKDVTVYGPKEASRRTSAVAFNIAGKDPMNVAEQLDKMRIESRAGCHCATLAHYYLEINPPASCRISPYFYNTLEEMRYIIKAIREISSEETPRRTHTLKGVHKILKTWTKFLGTFRSNSS